MSNRSDFTIQLPAKWVLSGEHAILRGGHAVAFPYSEFSLKLSYRAPKNLQANALKIHPSPFQNEILDLIEHAKKLLKVYEFFGEVKIESTIPPGAGLGSSAALSLAIAALLMKHAQQSEDLSLWKKLATQLENRFHGQSSGMDVSVIAEESPMRFFGTLKPAERLILNKLPSFKLFDSGMRSSTQRCIEQVQKWRQDHPTHADQVDQRMSEASDLTTEALFEFQVHEQKGLLMLSEAMKLAQSCFEEWGLITPELKQQKEALYQQGALGVKITGAGLGGYWAALWPSL